MAKVLCLLALVVGLLSSNLGGTQTLTAFEQAGDEAILRGDFHAAAAYYKTVLDAQPLSKRRHYDYAEACRATFNLKEALKSYQMVATSREQSEFPLVHFRLGTVLQLMGNFEAASKSYQRFLSISKDSVLLAKTRLNLEGCRQAKKWMQPQDGIRHERLPDEINTRYSEFSPLWVKDTLYYSSLMFNTKGSVDRWANILASPNLATRGNKVRSINAIETHNTGFTLGWDGSFAIFSRCNTEDGSNSCQLWSVTRNKKGEWGTPTLLPASINKQGYSYTQPALAIDPLTGDSILLFSSNQSGGKGLYDLWFSRVGERGTTFSIPENLSAYNSPYNEGTPFLVAETGVLYFSSDWYAGLGGFDNFAAAWGTDDSTTITNLGFPFNSSANDYYLTFRFNDPKQGFFASNRAESKPISGESCCNDLYSFSQQTAFVFPPPPPIPSVDTPLVEIPSLDSVSLTLLPPKKEPPVSNPPVEEPVPANPPVHSQVITLYFHNDEPDSNTTNLTTLQRYENSYTNYITLKPIYFKQNSVAAKALSDFFEQEVVYNYSLLNSQLQSIYQKLQQGRAFHISIAGFTSPRSPADYNIALASRRVYSLINTLNQFEDKALQPYIASGKLILTFQIVGEAQAPATVNDRYDMPQLSIYSVEAARERRIQVTITERKSN